MDYTGSNNASGQIMAGEEGFEIAYNKRKAQAQILGANGAEITHVAPGTKILNHADSKKSCKVVLVKHYLDLQVAIQRSMIS